MDKELEETLKYDALANAERVTGKSYKEDRSTLAMGFSGHIAHGRQKDVMLRQRDDTCFCEKLDNYLRIVEAIDFKKVLEVPFTVHDEGEAPRTEALLVYWLDGILLEIDSFHGDRNRATMYYNWKAHDPKVGWKLMSSGYWTEEGVLIGDHDAREALRHTVAKLKEHGEFLSKWIGDPRPWLVHYGDTRANPDPDNSRSGYYDKIIEKRIRMLPLEIQEAIKPSADPSRGRGQK